MPVDLVSTVSFDAVELNNARNRLWRRGCSRQDYFLFWLVHLSLKRFQVSQFPLWHHWRGRFGWCHWSNVNATERAKQTVNQNSFLTTMLIKINALSEEPPSSRLKRTVPIFVSTNSVQSFADLDVLRRCRPELRLTCVAECLLCCSFDRVHSVRVYSNCFRHFYSSDNCC